MVAGVRRWYTVPEPGKKPASGRSAYTRASKAWPERVSWGCVRGSGSPAATRSCHSTRSMPLTISVTGCSTCRARASESTRADQ